MTKRTPPTMTMPGWIEHQIRSAEAEGAFENLPGAGKPIKGLGDPRPELAWVADYLRRENVDVAELLPPQLAIAREVEKLRERLLTEASERSARAVVDDLNERISAAHARPQIGPVFRVKLVAVEPAIEQWRSDRAALLELRDAQRAQAAQRRAAAEAALAQQRAARRRWFRRRSA
jgi:hypothetical protein